MVNIVADIDRVKSTLESKFKVGDTVRFTGLKEAGDKEYFITKGINIGDIFTIHKVETRANGKHEYYAKTKGKSDVVFCVGELKYTNEYGCKHGCDCKGKCDLWEEQSEKGV